MRTLAAYTPTEGYRSFPPYFNASVRGGCVVVTVRGPETARPAGGIFAGEMGSISIPIEEARRLFGEALELL